MLKRCRVRPLSHLLAGSTQLHVDLPGIIRDDEPAILRNDGSLTDRADVLLQRPRNAKRPHGSGTWSTTEPLVPTPAFLKNAEENEIDHNVRVLHNYKQADLQDNRSLG